MFVKYKTLSGKKQATDNSSNQTADKSLNYKSREIFNGKNECVLNKLI